MFKITIKKYFDTLYVSLVVWLETIYSRISYPNLATK